MRTDFNLPRRTGGKPKNVANTLARDWTCNAVIFVPRGGRRGNMRPGENLSFLQYLIVGGMISLVDYVVTAHILCIPTRFFALDPRVKD